MERVSRREFSAGLMAAVPLVAATVAAGAEDAKTASSQTTKPAVGKPEAEPRRELTQVDRLVEVAVRAHPDERLDAAALAEIRGDVEQLLSRATALARVPLTNGDEPGFAFGAFRREG